MEESTRSMAEAIGASLDEAREKLAKHELRDRSQTPKGSMAYLYFSLLSIAIDAKYILDIGTGLGGGANALSKLFPDSVVYTIDVPPSDKNYYLSYRSRRRNGARKFQEYTARDNIVFIESNSFFLPSLELPDKFDFIWVDGSHILPALAWDMMFAYNHLRPGGVMGMHDYLVSGKPHFREGKIVIDYIESRIKEKILLLPGHADVELSKNVKIAHITKL